MAYGSGTGSRQFPSLLPQGTSCTSFDRAVLAATLVTAAFAACAPARKPSTAPSPASDPRNSLKAGLFDAGEYASNMRVLARAQSPKGFLGETNSDLAFTGDYVI